MAKNKNVFLKGVVFGLIFSMVPVLGVSNEIHDAKVIKITDTSGIFSKKSLYVRYYPNNTQWQTSVDGKFWMIVSNTSGIKSSLLEKIVSELKGKNHLQGFKVIEQHLQTQDGDVENNVVLTGYSTDEHGNKLNKILSVGDIPYSLKNKALTKDNQYYIFGQITGS